MELSYKNEMTFENALLESEEPQLKDNLNRSKQPLMIDTSLAVIVLLTAWDSEYNLNNQILDRCTLLDILNEKIKKIT